MTEPQLQAENERLRAENAALRDLLAAVTECARVPLPAGDDMRRANAAAWTRARVISVYAASIPGSDEPALVPILATKAEALREEAARPLRYEPETTPEAEGSGK